MFIRVAARRRLARAQDQLGLKPEFFAAGSDANESPAARAFMPHRRDARRSHE
jgi:hypothetical protein